ncbi:MAG: DUF4595 domain-containing protein [Bacteroidetes bacterium]|nr:DUF4595 domain-containing protein [Bacteroidota bacterium]
MKPFLLAAAALLLLTISACKKENKTPNCTLVTRASLTDSARISYDAQGRVATYEIVGESVYTFNYTSALAAQCVVSIPGNPTYTTYNVFLNSNGTVSSMSNSIVIGGTNIDYTYYFTYNAEGRIAKCLQRYDQTGGISVKLDSMVYENGNLVRKFKFVSASVTGPFYLQEYAITTYTDRPNKMGYHAFSFVEEPTSLLSGFYPFFHLYGKASDKLPAETNVYTNTGTLSFKMNYTYLLDENGYVTEENVSRSILAPSTENRRFGYSCE